jgi:AraC family transcriptional regulator
MQARLFAAIPREAGPRLTTFRGGAAHLIRPPSEMRFTPPDNYVAVILSPSPAMELGFAGDRMHKFDAPIGMLAICPAQVETRSVWKSPKENVFVALPPEVLAELALEETNQGSAVLQPVPVGTVDRKALRLAQMMKEELSEGEGANELYVDTLITLFGIHILRNYGGGSRPRRSAQGGLPMHKARQVQEFLHANLARKISVADLAAVCDLSAGYFFQAFTQTFGQSPHQYLLNLRLTTAERLLVMSDLKIVDIAHLAGFSSQSHLSAAMRRYKGTTPTQIRASK